MILTPEEYKQKVLDVFEDKAYSIIPHDLAEGAKHRVQVWEENIKNNDFDFMLINKSRYDGYLISILSTNKKFLEWLSNLHYIGSELFFGVIFENPFVELPNVEIIREDSLSYSNVKTIYAPRCKTFESLNIDAMPDLQTVVVHKKCEFKAYDDEELEKFKDNVLIKRP